MPGGKSSSLIPLTAEAQAGTTPIRWVRALPGRRASRVQLIGVATTETLYEILLVGRCPGSAVGQKGEVLRDISVGEPVFLTKNGRGRYVLIDMEDYEKTQATLKLLSELAKGEKSGREKGWFSLDDIVKTLGVSDE